MIHILSNWESMFLLLKSCTSFIDGCENKEKMHIKMCNEDCWCNGCHLPDCLEEWKTRISRTLSTLLCMVVRLVPEDLLARSMVCLCQSAQNMKSWYRVRPMGWGTWSVITCTMSCPVHTNKNDKLTLYHIHCII